MGSLVISGELTAQLNELRFVNKSGASKSLQRLDSSASNMRFKGTESLGNGASASFYVSAGLRTDTGTGGFCNRECFVRLSGQAGSLTIGRLLPVYDDVSLPWYYIAVPGNHNPLALWANCGNGAGLESGCQDNFITAIRYDSAAFGPVSASVSVADLSPDITRAEGRAHGYTAGLQYRVPSLYLGAAMQRQLGTRYVGAVDDALTVSLEWKGTITIGAGFERLSYSVASGGSVARDYAGVMLSKGIGPSTVWLNAGRAAHGHGSAAAGSAVNNVKQQTRSAASMYSAGYAYSLSKLTKLYGFYNTIANGPNAGYSFDTSTSSMFGTGQRISSWVVGVSHKF